LNAVNYDGQQSGDYGQAAIADTITEAVPVSHTGINALSAYVSGFAVYPTLMNDNVTVAFDLKQASAVRVELLSMQGQVVKTLVSQESIAAGSFRHSYDVNELSVGVYLCRLQIGNAWAVSKVVKE
ncbi:MAG: T9SS type A sorting domain-containing protein, partial [Legionellales bacterium]